VSNSKIHAVARCELCRQVLLDETIEDGEQAGFRQRAYCEKHRCKIPTLSPQQLRDIKFTPVENET